MTIVQFFLSNYIVFFSLFGFGLLLFKKIKEIDIFFLLLIGYTLVGLIALIINFIFPINSLISFVISFIGLVIFIFNIKKFSKTYNLKELILFHGVVSFLLILKTNHPIDANMYHNPFISAVNAEKIIFGLSNIQFRFGHISFMQYVQSIYTNKFFLFENLSSINLILYSVFVYFVFKKIYDYKKNDIFFFILSSIIFFVLIKFSRFNGFGNDLAPLLFSFYLLINFSNYLITKKIDKNFLIYLPILIFLIFMHKISYIFIVLFYFFYYKEIKINYLKKPFFLIFIILLTLAWFGKNIVHSSCIIYPIENTCFKSLKWYPTGKSDPKKAKWLSEVWAKDFINKDNWQETDLDEYIANFNWVSTWLQNHFIKLVEKVSPLLMLLLILWVLNLKKINNKKIILKSNFYLLYNINLICLIFWFINAPLFRYGAFFIATFLILTFVIILSKFSYFFQNNHNNRNLKFLVLIALIFFSTKNIIRISSSNNTLLPKTTLDKNQYDEFKNNGLIMLKTNNGMTCHYSGKVCSHEIPRGIKVKRKNNYFYLY